MAGFLPTNQASVEALLLKVALLLEQLNIQSINHGFFIPINSADADAPNNTIYYSTTANKLVFKDSGGTVNDLY